jgi:hypothetical protein
MKHRLWSLEERRIRKDLEQATPEQRALFLEHYRRRPDGGMGYTLLDHLYHLDACARQGWDPVEHCKSDNWPTSYWKSLRALPRTPEQQRLLDSASQDRS